MSGLSGWLRIVRGLPRSLPFWLADGRSSRRDAVLIVARGSLLDADTMPLLRELAEQASWEIGLAVDSACEFDAACGWFVAAWRDRVRVIERDSADLERWLLRSFLVFLTSASDLVDQRIASRAERRSFVRLYHGLIAKGYGRLAAERRGLAGNAPADVLGHAGLGEVRVDVHAVASEMEGFFRAAADGGHPAFYKAYGYPRYDRIAELRNGSAPWLPAASRTLIERLGDKRRILYAPTHKDGRAATTLFPLEEFEPAALRDTLARENCVLLLRMHLLEEQGGAYDSLVDGETILYAGRDFSVSPLELLPFVDVLVTDYSSIYMDFLPFDRPIVFVQDSHDHFATVRGFAFDYDRYFPGRKVKRWGEFVAALERSLAGDDGCQEERRFVRRVLLPDLPGTFLDRLLRDPRVASLLP